MRVRALAVGLAAVLTLTGCGGGGVSVTGKVVNGSRDYNKESDGDITIGLGDAGRGGSGTVQPDGTFKVAGEGGRGLPAGKYKVSVTRYPTPAEMAKAKGSPGAVTKDTGEVWDVGAGTSTFTLDLSKVK